MVTIYFTKQFTGGLLKGLTHTGSMQFVSIERASEWVSWARKGCRKPIGGSPYKVIDASFQNYQR